MNYVIASAIWSAVLLCAVVVAHRLGRESLSPILQMEREKNAALQEELDRHLDSESELECLNQSATEIQKQLSANESVLSALDSSVGRLIVQSSMLNEPGSPKNARPSALLDAGWQGRAALPGVQLEREPLTPESISERAV